MEASTLHYTESLLGGPPDSHHWRRGLSTIISAAFGGYMVTSLHPKFLLLFENPIMQFFICLLIFNLDPSKGVPSEWIFYDAFLVTSLLQFLDLLTNWYYDDGEMERERWTDRLGRRDLVGIGFALVIGVALLYRWRAGGGFRWS